MQFSPEQYYAIIAIAVGTVVFGAINYWCGRVDRAQMTKHWQDQYEKQAKTNTDLRQDIVRNRLNADAMRQQVASMAETLTMLQGSLLTDKQRASIDMASRQLSLCAQMMDAIGNTESGKTQRKLAGELTDIAAINVETAA